jgi:hypothetical protein
MSAFQPEAPTPLLSRRNFLQLSMGGSAALATLGVAANLAGCGGAQVPLAPGYGYLRAADLALFRVLVAAVAGPAMPKEAEAAEARIKEALARIDLGCRQLGLPAQGDFRKLLDLLAWGPFRRFAGGIPVGWEQASVQQAQEFLGRWRASGIGLFNAGYRGLVQACGISFWGQRASWAAAGYPGPPAWAVQALNA